MIANFGAATALSLTLLAGVLLILAVILGVLVWGALLVLGLVGMWL